VGDGELGAHDGALGFPLRHVPAQAPVLGAEEGLGPARSGGGLAEGAAEVGVAAAGGVLSLPLAAGLLDVGREPGPGAQVPGGREDGHIDADLGDQVLGRRDAEAGDGVELGDLRCIRLAQDGDPDLSRMRMTRTGRAPKTEYHRQVTAAACTGSVLP
jgi:hypothetical protein